MERELPVVWIGSSRDDLREFPEQIRSVRMVYTVRFPEAVVVLHAFKKKSSHARKTDQRNIDRVDNRLKWAEELHENGVLLDYGDELA